MTRIWLVGAVAIMAALASVGPASANDDKKLSANETESAPVSDAETFLKKFLKTAPKAPDAWCQRYALNQAGAVLRGQGGADALAPSAEDSEAAKTCNPEYLRQLIACARTAEGTASSAHQELAAASSARIRRCMAELADKGVRPAL